MSPRWRDEVAIYLAPRKLALVRRARGLGSRTVAEVESAVPGSSFGEIGPVVSRLAEVLADPTWHGAAARVVVADHPWARYGIVRWPAARLDAAGRLAHARYVLGDIYGEAVADWTVSLADTPPGLPSVACAVPATLRGALEDALAPARLSLVSMQPQLVVAYNLWRHRLPADGTWFVRMDDGSLSAVHLSGGAWDGVHTARLSQDWTVELERLQAFVKLTRAVGVRGHMLVDAPVRMRRGAAASDGFEWLEEVDGDGTRAHELALLQGMCA